MSTIDEPTSPPRRRGRPATKITPPAPVMVASAMIPSIAPPTERRNFAPKLAAFPVPASFPGYDEILRFGQDNAKALAKSSSILVDAMRSLTEEMASFGKSSFDDSIASSKAFLQAKTVQELFALSQSVAKSSIGKLAEESTKLTRLSTKFAEDAIAPLKSRVDEAVTHMSVKAL